MNKLFVAALAGVLGLGSVSFADRYDRQRYEASVRYERGSRNHDRTYVRYGQDSHHRRHDLGRDRYDRRDHYAGRPSSGWGFALGYGSGYGYAGDSVSLGLYYSNRPSVYYRHHGYRYHHVPHVYERRVRTYYDDCGPTVYEYREYRTPPTYYRRSSGSGWAVYSRGYYSR